ncbi:hypothetical protein J31TS3_36140 [Paenibacillus lactis]|nr:hypothetical protein J31TS3_36140 [Paenibacillus lactis]
MLLNQRHSLAIVEGIRPLAEQRGWSLPQFALNWVLSRPGITSAIVGASKPEHISETLKHSDERLTEEELKEVDRLTEELRG